MPGGCLRVLMECLNGNLLSQYWWCQDRSSQDRSSQDRSSQNWLSHDRSSQDRSSWDRSSHLRTGQLRSRQVKKFGSNIKSGQFTSSCDRSNQVLTRQLKFGLVESDRSTIILSSKSIWTQNTLENGVWLWRWPNLFVNIFLSGSQHFSVHGKLPVQIDIVYVFIVILIVMT